MFLDLNPGVLTGILDSDKILIFSLFVGCFYRKDPALMKNNGQLNAKESTVTYVSHSVIAFISSKSGWDVGKIGLNHEILI